MIPQTAPTLLRENHDDIETSSQITIPYLLQMDQACSTRNPHAGADSPRDDFVPMLVLRPRLAVSPSATPISPFEKPADEFPQREDGQYD